MFESFLRYFLAGAELTVLDFAPRLNDCFSVAQ